MITHPRRVAAVFVSALIALAMAEAVVRVFNLDERYMEKSLYRSGADRDCLEPVLDPILLYRPRPGSCRGDRDTFFINSRRARSPEHPAQKPADVFRVVVTGGSNVWGADVSDDQTWPAQLERALAERTGRRVEVWNYGQSAAVGVQQIALAEESLTGLSPDLLILAPSNIGVPAFLEHSPKSPLFTAYPQAFFDLVLPPGFRDSIPLPDAWRLALVRRSRLARYVLLGVAAAKGYQQKPVQDALWEPRNIEAYRVFLDRESGRARVVILIAPPLDDSIVGDYIKNAPVPVIRMSSAGLPPEYDKMHPPPDVLAWYGRTIAEALIDRGLVSTP